MFKFGPFRFALALVLGFPFPSVHADSPVVRFETNRGSFTLQLNRDKAPVTVANFLAYLSEGFYANTLFHRSLGGFVVQGGGFDATTFAEKATHSPIVNEADNGLSNLRGTIAMARTSARDSATAQFFVNVGDNSGTLDFGSPAPNQDGYAVFGQVTQGLEVIDAINALPAAKSLFSNVKAVFQDMPVVDAAAATFVTVQFAGLVLPQANAGANLSIEAGGNASLDGSASSDTTPGTSGVLTYQWTQVAGPTVALTDADGPTPGFTAPSVVSDTTFGFQLAVTNSLGNQSVNAASVNVTVKALQASIPQAPAPSIPGGLNCESASAEPSLLWPANRKMKSVGIRGIGGVKPFSVEVTQVTSDESVINKAGRDTTGPDGKIRKGKVSSVNPQAVDTVKLRAERQFNPKKPQAAFNGRVYTVVFTANDGTESCKGSVKVGVPVDVALTPVEDGEVHQATKRRD